MKKFLLSCLVLALYLCIPANAQGPRYSGVNYASISLTANTQLVAAPTALAAIHVLAYEIQVVQTSSAVSFGLTNGTGSACATGQALVTPAYAGVVSTTQYITFSTPIDLPLGKALCLTMSGAPIGAIVHVVYQIY